MAKIIPTIESSNASLASTVGRRSMRTAKVTKMAAVTKRRSDMGAKSLNQTYKESVANLQEALRTVERSVGDLFIVHGEYDQAAASLSQDAMKDTVHDRQLRLVWNHDPRKLDAALEPVREWLKVAKALQADLPSGDFSPAFADDLVGDHRLTDPKPFKN